MDPNKWTYITSPFLCGFTSSFVTIWLAPDRYSNKLVSSQTIFSYFQWIYFGARRL